jgi:hypothetical protein
VIVSRLRGKWAASKAPDGTEDRTDFEWPDPEAMTQKPSCAEMSVNRRPPGGPSQGVLGLPVGTTHDRPTLPFCARIGCARRPFSGLARPALLWPCSPR